MKTVLLLFLLFANSVSGEVPQADSLKIHHFSVNLNHALSLVDSFSAGSKDIAYISIYSDAPRYQPVEAKDEGIGCVDDAGRFMEVLEFEILMNHRTSLLPAARGIANFLLQMSNADGTWYNFIFSDHTINKIHKNSRADFGWWAVRGLRGLAAAYNIFHSRGEGDIELLNEISMKISLAIPQIGKFIDEYPSVRETTLGNRPAWLVNDAPDQTAELLIALTKLHRSGDFDFRNAIEIFSEGLILYQHDQPGHEPDGMYFCWDNIWHNWGNNQAFALLEAYKITKNPAIIKSVEKWADIFVPFLIKNNMPRKLILDGSGTFRTERFPQIAYGINSVYRGIKSLADITGDPEYEKYSEQVFSWFTGHNIAGIPMYDPVTGRGYDGINAADSVNKNSGAESTIECLLAVQMRGLFTTNK